jgi:Asp/Glu/hydantoin racemase
MDEAKKIAVLHTSFVFVQVELIINDLIAEMMPEVQVIHFVDSDVLATVVREGGISEKSAARMTFLAQAAEAAGADVIFSACSSLGPALDVAAKSVSVPVIKIDEAMAIEAAERATRIGVLATVPTTLGPTSDLIQSKADAAGKDISLTKSLAEGAFQVLMGGDRPMHDQMVTKQAVELAKEVDLIVLSQASMNRLAESLAEVTGLPVLSSPRRGVGYLAEIVKGL